LSELKNSYIRELSIKTGLTYAQTWKIIYNLQFMGIIVIGSKGRKVTVRLTKKGEKLAKYLNNIMSILETSV